MPRGRGSTGCRTPPPTGPPRPARRSPAVPAGPAAQVARAQAAVAAVARGRCTSWSSRGAGPTFPPWCGRPATPGRSSWPAPRAGRSSPRSATRWCTGSTAATSSTGPRGRWPSSPTWSGRGGSTGSPVRSLPCAVRSGAHRRAAGAGHPPRPPGRQRAHRRGGGRGVAGPGPLRRWCGRADRWRPSAWARPVPSSSTCAATAHTCWWAAPPGPASPSSCAPWSPRSRSRHLPTTSPSCSSTSRAGPRSAPAPASPTSWAWSPTSTTTWSPAPSPRCAPSCGGASDSSPRSAPATSTPTSGCAARSCEPVPRLVVVVDELRALVDELPGFVTGLVGLAALGRSLGVHLVLATQRPAGAVSADIQANVSLRDRLPGQGPRRLRRRDRRRLGRRHPLRAPRGGRSPAGPTGRWSPSRARPWAPRVPRWSRACGFAPSTTAATQPAARARAPRRPRTVSWRRCGVRTGWCGGRPPRAPWLAPTARRRRPDLGRRRSPAERLPRRRGPRRRAGPPARHPADLAPVGGHLAAGRRPGQRAHDRPARPGARRGRSLGPGHPAPARHRRARLTGRPRGTAPPGAPGPAPTTRPPALPSWATCAPRWTVGVPPPGARRSHSPRRRRPRPSSSSTAGTSCSRPSPTMPPTC